jgi:beta-lactamase class D
MTTTTSRRRRNGAVGALVLLSLLSACSGPGGKGAAPKINSDTLDAAIDNQLGGLETCVALADASSGHIVYQYGHADVCDAPLPPCGTFEIAGGLIGLEQGVVPPGAVWKWDGTPQPVQAWQTDADLSKAFADSIGWWWAKLAQSVGTQRMTAALHDLDYGSRTPSGAPSAFWQGPAAGGGLTISTRQQIGFLKRFYAGQPPVDAKSAAAIAALMVDETRSDAKGGRFVFSAKPGDCASAADGSSNVGWSVGRLQTPDRDILFAASVDAAEAPPGLEIGQRLKGIFAQAGLWPAG